jgi:hypothetical protein
MGLLESLSLCVSFADTSKLARMPEVVTAATLVSQVVVPTQPVLPPTPRSAPASTPARQSFPTLNSEQFDKQLKRYLQYVADYGAPDILIVGSSRALWGVDPIALRSSLQQRGYPNLKIYNFGINGGTAQVADLQIRLALNPNQLPRLIVWADNSRAFNSGRVDHTYNNILSSPGYRFLAAGKRPTLPSPTANVGQLCIDLSSNPFTKLPAQQVTPFQRNSGTTTSGVPCDRPFKISLQPDRSTKAKSLTEMQEALGFQPLSEKFNPTTYFQRYPRVAGRFDADYRDFNLAGAQTTALNRLLQFTRSRRVPVVFVNLPLTRDYLDGTRTAYEQEFRAFMQQYANRGLLTFYDLSQRWQTQHEYFLDPSHLNRYGAVAVAGAIAERLATNRGLTMQLACETGQQSARSQSGSQANL